MTSLPDHQSSGCATNRVCGCAVGAALLLLLAVPIAASAQQRPGLRPGDIVVDYASQVECNPPVPPQVCVVISAGGLAKIDGAGAWTNLTDFGDAAHGPTFAPPQFPTYLAIADPARVFFIHGTRLAQLDPSMGVRMVISDFGDPSQGPLLPDRPRGLAIEPSGDFLIVHGDYQESALIRIERATGIRTIVSNLYDPTQGPALVSPPPIGVVVEQSGHIVIGGVIAASEDPFDWAWVLLRIDAVSGQRTIVSNFNDPMQGFTGNLLNLGKNLALDHAGNIVAVVARRVGNEERLELFRVDPTTGVRTLISDGALSAVSSVGPVAVGESDELVLIGRVQFDRSQSPVFGIFRVDQVTGDVAVISDRSPRDIALVPTPLVNDLVSLSVVSTAVEPSNDDAAAPAGVFTITASFTNTASTPIRNAFFRVAELSGENLLVNTDRQPVVAALSGRGARLTPDAGSDGVLAPGEALTVEFRIGLQSRRPFSFLVSVFGEADASD